MVVVLEGKDKRMMKREKMCVCVIENALSEDFSTSDSGEMQNVMNHAKCPREIR